LLKSAQSSGKIKWKQKWLNKELNHI
jgi:hypothetical protein